MKALVPILLLAASCVAPETGPDTTGQRIGAGIDRGQTYLAETPPPNPSNPFEPFTYGIGGLAALAGTVKGSAHVVNRQRDAKRKTRGEPV